jgi:hypothetical protein
MEGERRGEVHLISTNNKRATVTRPPPFRFLGGLFLLFPIGPLAQKDEPLAGSHG